MPTIVNPAVKRMLASYPADYLARRHAENCQTLSCPDLRARGKVSRPTTLTLGDTTLTLRPDGTYLINPS